MGKWTSRTGRGAILALLLLVAGMLPGAGLLRGAPVPAATIVQGTRPMNSTS